MSIKTGPTIQAVIFDLGGVLVDWKREHLYRKMFDGDPAGMAHFLTEICPMSWNLKLDKGYPFATAVEEKVAEFPEFEEYIRAYHTRWEEMVPGDIPESVDLLSEMRGQGYSLHVLSNFSTETYPRMKSRFGFLDWFDSILLSGDVGMAKPEPEIYQLLLDRIGLAPGQCLFIDDSFANVIAAWDLGIEAVQFVSAEELRLNLVERKLI
ncbi:MAG: HAD family phosphatase [Anaerolineales bacterium]|nr:HAD family phosphatase [Anaerolineales bacterium]